MAGKQQQIRLQWQLLYRENSASFWKDYWPELLGLVLFQCNNLVGEKQGET